MQKTSKNSFVLYHNFFNQIVLLDMQARGELITAIYQYETCGELTMELSPMVMMAFSFIKDSLDRDRKAYEARVESSRENGKKGGRPKNSQSEITHSVYAKPRKADNGNDNGNGNDNENEIDNVTVKERDVRKKEKEKGKPTLFSLRVFPEFRFPRLRFLDSVFSWRLRRRRSAL